MAPASFSSTRRFVLGCLASTIALAGCTHPAQPGGESTPSLPPLEESVTCSEDLSVSFYAVNDLALWNAGELLWGGTIPATDSTYFFVGFVDGSIAGTATEQGGGEDSIAVDGGRIPLDQTYRGTHMAKIIVFQDSNQDGEFDIETDRPCSDGTEIVATMTREIDFSKVRDN